MSLLYNTKEGVRKINRYVLAVLVENHSGVLSKTSAFIELMKPFGIKEIVRTGLTAVERGCTHTK